MSKKETWARLAEPASPEEEYKAIKLVLYVEGLGAIPNGPLYYSNGTEEKPYQYREGGFYQVCHFSQPICERLALLLHLPLEVREGPKK
jgi:hypothetical protein